MDEPRETSIKYLSSVDSIADVPPAPRDALPTSTQLLLPLVAVHGLYMHVLRLIPALSIIQSRLLSALTAVCLFCVPLPLFPFCPSVHFVH